MDVYVRAEECSREHEMNTKKLVPLLIVLLGIALVIAAFVVWLEPPTKGGVFSVAGGIISFLAGLGTSIKGWKDLLKKDVDEKSAQTQSQTQSQIINVYTTPPPYQVTNSQSSKNTLPTQPFFFGRETELQQINEALCQMLEPGVS